VDTSENENGRAFLFSEEIIDFYLLIRAFEERVDLRKSLPPSFRKTNTLQNISD